MSFQFLKILSANLMSLAAALAGPWRDFLYVPGEWSGNGTDYLAGRLTISPVSGIGFRGQLRTEEYNDFPHFEWLPISWTKTPSSIVRQSGAGTASRLGEAE